MIDVLLLILGLSIGAVFLVALLISDKREARLKAQHEQQAMSREQAGDTWPPPPVSAEPLHSTSQPAESTRLAAFVRGGRIFFSVFFRLRSYAVVVIIASYVIAVSFPHLRFGWVLLTTTAVMALFSIFIIKLKRQS